MKTSIKTIILAAASIFSAMSCQKEAAVPGTQDQIKTGETIQVNINACLGNLVSADGTKATAESVIRLKWNGTESHPEYVKAYCGTNLISTENGLKAIASENGLFAKLTGEITTTDLTSGTSVITLQKHWPLRPRKSEKARLTIHLVHLRVPTSTSLSSAEGNGPQ